MAIRYHNTLKNALLEAYETTFGTSVVLRIYSGTVAGSVGTAPSDTLLATITAPTDWMANAASGSKGIAGGPWTDTAADGTGTAGCYTLSTSGGTIYEDGTVTATGGGGDLTLDNTSLVTGQQVSITGFNKSI